MFGWIDFFFWISVLSLLHAYIAYPALVWLLARALEKSGDQQSNQKPAERVGSTELPRITVLIAAYNAEKHLRKRIENILQCDYPMDRLQIVVASDGSTDDTVAVLRSMNVPNLTYSHCSERLGKAATLTRSVRSIKSDVVLFTDVTTQFCPESIRAIGSRFKNPKVGVVSGCVHMLDSTGQSSEGIYWKLEGAVRQAEAKLGILTGVSGAIYAMRRSLFVAPDQPTTNDDMVFPILAKLKHRFEFQLEPEAIAYVTLPDQPQLEFIRRRRIGCGAFQSMKLLIGALNPSLGLSAFALFSHKFLRWFGPFALIVALSTNVILSSAPFYFLLLLGQITVYGLAFSADWLSRETTIGRLARIASSFFSMNLALLYGFLDWVHSSGQVTWEPTTRPEQMAPRG